LSKMGRLATFQQIYFDPFADESDWKEGDLYLEEHEELRTKLDRRVNDERVVQLIWYYNPLSKHQLTYDYMVNGADEYIVLETSDHFWWSIEKNGEGVTIQRSKQFDAVAKLYRRQKRLQGWFWKRVVGLQIKMRSSGKSKQLSELVEKIWTDELNRTYDELTDNCHDFAERTWNFLN